MCHTVVHQVGTRGCWDAAGRSTGAGARLYESPCGISRLPATAHEPNSSEGNGLQYVPHERKADIDCIYNNRSFAIKLNFKPFI